MEKDKALNLLQNGLLPQVHGAYYEALKMAIQALEQEPCEDAISRQAVKEQMIKYGFYAPDMTITEFIENLPPVQPVVCIAKISFDDQQIEEMVNEAISNLEPSVQSAQR